MKLKKLIYSIPLAAIIFVAVEGCKKTQFDINLNTNNPTDSTVTFDVILPAALHATGTTIATQWGTIQNWMGYWARSGTYAANVTEETYQITTGFGTGVWNSCYDNNYDYQIMENKAHLKGAGYYEGIARIMKALNYQMLVDVYGNVPYLEALKGSANPTPKYDKGIDIYKDLFRQLDTAITLIKGYVASLNKDIATNDIMFGGNTTKWVQFANTLKLRLIIHAYAVSGFPITTEMATINTEGSGFLSEDAQVQPGYKSDKPNPFFNSYKSTTTGTQTANNVYYRANEWGIGYYDGDHDPRETRLYEAGSAGLAGVAYGLPPITDNASAVLAGIGPGLYKTNSSPQAILTAAESYFLQAEARQRGIITAGPTAAQLVESGKLASMTYLGVSGAAAALTTYNSFNAGYPDVDFSATPLAAGYPAGGIFTILSQKWFALNGVNTLEVWTDYRRVPYSSVATSSANDHFVYGQGAGYTPGPPISVAPQNTSTKIPVRYLYPQTEYNYNAANVGGEGTINAFSSRIFWDIN